MILGVKRSVCELDHDFKSNNEQFASWFMILREEMISL